MTDNTALVTDAAKDAAQRMLDDYAAGVAAHLGGDWGQHNQARVYAQFYNETVTGHQVSDRVLRLELTLAGSARTVKIPCLLTAETPDDSGAPLIITQPASLSVVSGNTASFSVVASATLPISYQWRKNGTAISGKTSSSLVIVNAQASDQATYSVVVTTATSSVTSNDATLTVTAASSGTGGGGGCFKKGTQVLRANGFGISIESLTPGSAIRSASIEGLDPGNENAWLVWQSKTLGLRPATSYVRAVRADRFHYYYVINGNLEVTYEHPLLVRRNGLWLWQRAQDVAKGDYLFKNNVATLVQTKVRVDAQIETYNLDVEPYDIYFANGYLVHNVTSKA